MIVQKPTGELRFKRKYVAGMAASQGGQPQLILQRQMQNIDDGTFSWEDVPVVDEGE